jgi:hypothetical protein
MRKLVGALVMLAAVPAQAAVISLGGLSVDINTGNGAIDSAALSGTEYYAHGYFVSDWMIQLNENPATYALNDNHNDGNAIGVPLSGVSCDASSCSVTAAFMGIEITRTYAVLAGNVLRTSTTLKNTGSSPVLVQLADAFDPDQGIPGGFDFDTFNDLFDGMATAVSEDVFSVTY